MDKQDVIKKLKELKSKRGILGKIEWEVGIPKNNLSAYVNGKKEMPNKWVLALSEYLENGGHLKKKIELPADYLAVKKIGVLKEDGTVEQISNFDQIPNEHYLVGLKWLQQLQMDETEFKRIPIDQWNEIQKKLADEKLDLKIPEKINYYDKKVSFSVVDKGKIPPMPTRNEGEDAFDFAQRKNEWKRLYQK